MEQHSMETEIPVDVTEPGSRAYVEVGVEEGDDYADVCVEDLETSVALRLSVEQLDALIASLMDARATAAANA